MLLAFAIYVSIAHYMYVCTKLRRKKIERNWGYGTCDWDFSFLYFSPASPVYWCVKIYSLWSITIFCVAT